MQAETQRVDPPTYAELYSLVGQEIGVSEWLTIDQPMIDRFAECTGDRQWIHVDVERAKRRSPFRSTIAHGYLTLSLIGSISQDMPLAPKNTQAVFNYGLDRVRFISPVRAGARLRMRVTLLSVELKGPRQHLMKAQNTMEIEGEEKPALVAETLVMLYESREKPGKPAEQDGDAKA